jgi:hypothetical protein
MAAGIRREERGITVADHRVGEAHESLKAEFVGAQVGSLRAWV